MIKRLSTGKKYWFRDGHRIYGGWFTGEMDEWGWPIICAFQGYWAVPAENLYETAKKAQGNTRHCIIVD